MIKVHLKKKVKVKGEKKSTRITFFIFTGGLSIEYTNHRPLVYLPPPGPLVLLVIFTVRVLHASFLVVLLLNNREFIYFISSFFFFFFFFYLQKI
jgi:hypothetical protein